MYRLNRKAEALSLPEGIAAPRYDVRAVKPGIVHIGLGGFHRAHLARYAHDLMEIDPKALGWGIVGAGLREADAPLLQTLARQDGLYTLVERDAAGETRSVIGSIVGVIDASASSAELPAAIASSEIKIVSLTVTEAGYCLDPTTRRLALDSAAVRHDLTQPHVPKTMPGVLVEAFAQRREAGLSAFTALSCDNIQNNGHVLREAILSLAKARDEALALWIADHARFPNTMVDRITPVPVREEIAAFAAKAGIADEATVFCERFKQWVIEDDFAGGRPDWSRVGAQFVRDVAPYEAMKLRLLNTSHLAISGLGALCCYETVEQTMNNPAITRYMQRLMREEIEPLLAPVPGIDLAEYETTLIARFANPAIRDTVRRINTVASINILLDPVRDALAKHAPLSLLALALAAWCCRVCDEVQRGETIAGENANTELQRKAAEKSDDPARLLSVEFMFGDLQRNERLMIVLHNWLAKLKNAGIDGVLREI